MYAIKSKKTFELTIQRNCRRSDKISRKVQGALQVSLASKPGFYDHIKAPHTAETTKKSFDLYLSRDGKDFVFIDVSKNIDGTEYFYDRRMLYLEEEQELDVLIVFPSYGGVDKVLIQAEKANRR